MSINKKPRNTEMAVMLEPIFVEWDKNHYLKKSEAIVGGFVSVHKDTDEPCAMNPCPEGLRLQELGIDIDMERIV